MSSISSWPLNPDSNVKLFFPLLSSTIFPHPPFSERKHFFRLRSQNTTVTGFLKKLLKFICVANSKKQKWYTFFDWDQNTMGPGFSKKLLKLICVANSKKQKWSKHNGFRVSQKTARAHLCGKFKEPKMIPLSQLRSIHKSYRISQKPKFIYLSKYSR